MNRCLLGVCDTGKTHNCCTNCPLYDKVICKGKRCPKVELNRATDCPHCQYMQ